jgi:hypothetical protein
VSAACNSQPSKVSATLDAVNSIVAAVWPSLCCLPLVDVAAKVAKHKLQQ